MGISFMKFSQDDSNFSYFQVMLSRDRFAGKEALHFWGIILCESILPIK